MEAQRFVREVHISADLIETVNAMVRHTRPVQSQIKFVKDWVRWGAGPRAGQAMILTAKAQRAASWKFFSYTGRHQKGSFPCFAPSDSHEFQSRGGRCYT